MKRAALLTRSPVAHAAVKPPKCPVCKRRTQDTRLRLHPECMEVWIARQVAKQDAAKKKRAAEVKRRERESFKARKEAIKRIPDLIREADKAFAEFIRERDRLAGHACISSGKPLDWSGNQVDAGHYRSRGAASHLRYHEDNCHAQTKRDNQFKAGNVVEYRIRLIARIGLARVEALEADNSVHHWTREELIGIRAEYRQRLKQLKESRK
jgi:hypothetical protein